MGRVTKVIDMVEIYSAQILIYYSSSQKLRNIL